MFNRRFVQCNPPLTACTSASSLPRLASLRPATYPSTEQGRLGKSARKQHPVNHALRAKVDKEGVDAFGDALEGGLEEALHLFRGEGDAQLACGIYAAYRYDKAGSSAGHPHRNYAHTPPLPTTCRLGISVAAQNADTENLRVGSKKCISCVPFGDLCVNGLADSKSSFNQSLQALSPYA